jgi:hypothetical protein
MGQETRTRRSYALRAWGLACAAALAAFLHLWLTVDIGALYYAPTRLFPVFRMGGSFFAEHTGYAGGLTAYAAAFLYQLFYFPWAGALVVVLAAILVSLAALSLARSVASEPPLLLAALPGVIVLLLADRYVHFLAGALALILATWAAAVWVRLSSRGAPVRLPALIAVSAGLYYLAGGACVCFAVLAAVGEALHGRFRWACACAACGAAVPFVWAHWLLPARLSDAYLRLLPLHALSDPGAWAVAVALFLSVPLVAVTAAAADLLGRRRRAARGDGACAGLRGRLGTAAVGALAAVAVAAVLLAHDGRTGAILRVQQAKETGDWEGVAAAARAMPRAWIDPVISWDVNLALHRSGTMLDRMFEFPQSPLRLMANSQVFDRPELQEAVSLQFGDVMLELGLVNYAEAMAFQGMELFGRRPWIVRRVVLTAGVRGEFEAAAVLLGFLCKDPFHGRWARQQLWALRDDAEHWDGERAKVLRSRLPERDRDALPPSYETMLAEQVARNPQNRAALDYLIGTYLTAGNLESVALRAGQLREAGYDRMPRHVDEALALQEARGGRGIDALVRPSAEARARLIEFADALSRSVSAGADARADLWERFGGTYFYYHAFGPQEGAAQ